MEFKDYYKLLEVDRTATADDIKSAYRKLAPAYEQAAKILEPQIRLAKVNTEEEQALEARFGIQSIPTVMLLRGGREVARQSGALGAQDIVQWVRAHL